MARRRLTLKRIDPWSVLKFGFVANLALLAIWLLGAGIIWFFVRQLELIEKVCEIAGDVGFVECGVNGGNLFRALLLLGLLGTVIQTGLIVFLAFLHNLIADLVGGITFTYTEEGSGKATFAPATTQTAARTSQATRQQQPVGASSSAGTAGRPAGSSAAPTDPSSGSGSAPSSPAPSAPTSPGAPSGGAPSTPPPSSPPSASGGSSGGDWDLFGPKGSGNSGS